MVVVPPPPPTLVRSSGPNQNGHIHVVKCIKCWKNFPGIEAFISVEPIWSYGENELILLPQKKEMFTGVYFANIMHAQ